MSFLRLKDNFNNSTLKIQLQLNFGLVKQKTPSKSDGLNCQIPPSVRTLLLKESVCSIPSPVDHVKVKILKKKIAANVNIFFLKIALLQKNPTIYG